MIEVVTDTATLVIFDKACLSHRKDDLDDWWSMPSDALKEVNDGNALFVNVGEDGGYLVNISSHDFPTSHVYGLTIRSGRLFIGPGEETSAGGFEPDGRWGGEFVDIEPGNYICKIRTNGNVVDLFFSLGGDGKNSLSDWIRL